MLTALDVFVLLALQRAGMRPLEAFVVALVLTVGACLTFECWLAASTWRSLAGALSPRLDAGSLYVAVAILGATVMPHNLYLHSSLVQTRAAPTTSKGCRRALRGNLVDTLIALNVAFVINASILVLAADVFHAAGIAVTDLREAQRLLSPLLGTTFAGVLFAVALLVGTQAVLSVQLPFAMVPLIRLTASRAVMGAYANRRSVTLLAWVATTAIIGCNAWLVVAAIGALSIGAVIVATALAVAAFALLIHVAIVPLRMSAAIGEALLDRGPAGDGSSVLRPL